MAGMQIIFEYAPVAASVVLLILLVNQKKIMTLPPIVVGPWNTFVFVLAVLLLAPFAAKL